MGYNPLPKKIIIKKGPASKKSKKIGSKIEGMFFKTGLIIFTSFVLLGSVASIGASLSSPNEAEAARFAEARGVYIKQYFVFLESASKEQQPIQQAIDYCKDASNGVNLFIIKSIDRFTRGGSDVYNPLKQQLDTAGVSLVDIYGVISSQKVNTLDHLGFEYRWSSYSPSKKSEILEAERGKDELRDILSRVIGA